MTPEFVVDIGRRALETALLISAPMLLTALLVGLIISVFQAATQINEQTMTFIPKLVGVFVVLLIFAPWILQKMMTLTLMIFDLLPTLGR
jgi:flagellar biosynthetic protein FliQ